MRSFIFCLPSDRRRISRECVYMYLVLLVWLFDLLWPWPWPVDLDVRTWPRYSEDVPSYQKWSFQAKAFISYSIQQDRHTDTDRHTDRRDRTHYHSYSRLVLVKHKRWAVPSVLGNKPQSWPNVLPGAMPVKHKNKLTRSKLKYKCHRD